MQMQVPGRILLAATLAAALLTADSLLAAQEPTTRCDPPAGSLASLTRAQKKAFMESQNAFIANHYSDALGELRNLLAQLPQDTSAQRAMAERTAEATIYAGEQTYAISLLKPIESRDGSDCPARTLLARAYAEQGQSVERDAEIAALNELHKQAPESPTGKLDAFLLEQHSLKGGGAVTIAYFLRPAPPHNTHLLAQIFDASGSPMLHIELDSDDGDQVYFKETHPDLAAKGDRRYSLDGILDKALPGYTSDDRHALIQFYDGEPSYDTVRERILAMADRAVGFDPKQLPRNAPVPGK
jgi:hypothetical protein